MKVSTKGRYALRMMVDIALYDTGDYISLREVAARQNLSMKYMEQIVSLLTKAGLLQSVRGPQGGYRLVKRPEDYTVEEILRATEGGLAPVACLEAGEKSCPRAENCATLGFWQEIYDVMLGYMQKTTLHSLVQAAQAKNGGEYFI